MSIAPIVLAQIGIMRKPHGANRRHDIMSISPIVLSQIDIMRKTHGAGRRHDIIKQFLTFPK